jgi:hypothetical protein
VRASSNLESAAVCHDWRLVLNELVQPARAADYLRARMSVTHTHTHAVVSRHCLTVRELEKRAGDRFVQEEVVGVHEHGLDAHLIPVQRGDLSLMS